MPSTDVTIDTVTMPLEAARSVEWAGVDVAADLARLRAGEVTAADLLAACLVGAEPEHHGDWRDYVTALEIAAAPALTTPAQLYWDDLDPNAPPGWSLRFWTADGEEQTAPIDGAKDEDAQALFTEAAKALPSDYAGKVECFRGEQCWCTARIEGGEVVDWRYL